jgi:pyridoxal 5'-phosphate synthase pdxT subunit
VTRVPRADAGPASRTVGVLGLQGDVREHLAALEELGVDGRVVRRGSELADLDGLIIPGGESTTLSLLLRSSGVLEPLRDRLAGGMPTLGTCAGLVLLATDVLDGRSDQVHLDAIDCTVRRNAYGRQAQSFETMLDATRINELLSRLPAGAAGDEAGDVGGQGELPAVFIRAPVIERVGGGVEVLADAPSGPSGNAPAIRAVPAVARQGNVLVASFHPELTPDRRVHRLLVAMVRGELPGPGTDGPGGDAAEPVAARTGR